MMSDALDECSHVIDASGLLEIANAQGNSKQVFRIALEEGIIAVPSVVWQEFKDLYEEEAEELEPWISTKVNIRKAYLIGAASIADATHSSFSQSPYNTHSDLCTAAICQVEGLVLLTCDGQMSYYDGLKCCEVETVADWLASQEE